MAYLERRTGAEVRRGCWYAGTGAKAAAFVAGSLSPAEPCTRLKVLLRATQC